MHRIVIFILCALAFAFQVRTSYETIRLQRTYEFYLPFTIRPFTNQIASSEYRRPGVSSGHRILAINHQPFRGYSQYLDAAWFINHAHPQSPAETYHPFEATLQTPAGPIHTVEFYPPHCSCGIPGLFESAALWLIPHLILITLGVLAVAANPRAILPWAFLAGLLSLTRIRVFPDAYSGFQYFSTPALWPHPFRLPALAWHAFLEHIWPAALLLAAASFVRHRKTLFRLTLAAAATFTITAILHAIAAIAWSEHYAPFAAWYRLLDTTTTERTAAAFAVIALLAFLFHRPLGLAVLAIGLITLAALLWPPAPITDGTLFTYENNRAKFFPSVPSFPRSPAFLTACYVLAVAASALIACWRHTTCVDRFAFLLCLPLAADFTIRFRYRGFSFFENWLTHTIPLALLGLTLFAIHRVKRAAPTRRPPPN